MVKEKIKDIAGLAEGLFKVLQEKGEQLPIKQILDTIAETVGGQVLDSAGFRREVDLKVRRLENFKGELPQYKTPGSSGMDIRARIDAPMSLEPGERVLVPTGLSMEVSLGYEIQARPRSGLALKKGLTLLNTPGTIDSDYRGEIQIILINLGNEKVEIADGERIAQLVICPVVTGRISLAKKLDKTERGEGGFGSTGVN